MIGLFFTLFANTLDFWILRKYLQCFSHKRKLGHYQRVILFVSCVLLLSAANFYGNPNVNLLFSFAIIYLYSFSFSYSCLYHVVMPILYIGLGFVSEPIGFLLTRRLGAYISPEMSYYISAFICEIIRYLLVRAICHEWYIKLPALSAHISLLLFLIPLSSVFISCIAIYLTGTYDNFTGNMLCLAIILMILLTNILTFAIFHKLNVLLSSNYEKELLLQEARAKEQYYKEVEEYNKKVQEIKHDLKNRLLALYATAEKDTGFHTEFRKILGELENGEKTIYTSNVIINTILNSKFHVAERKKIKVSTSILVPKEMNLDYSDAGILLGNLLDNATEACEKLPAGKRWMSLNMLYKEHMLILKVSNSKDGKKVDINKSRKRNLVSSGIGTHSVKCIAEKYNGTVSFMDMGETFEVCAVLYGIF
jgi:two-component system sensor histidine kinase AgrC